MSTETLTTENIIVESRGRVGLIRLNRPQALNALNAALMRELAHAIDGFEADGNIGCVVITGSDKAFAAGADIKEIAGQDFTEVFLGNFAATWIVAQPSGDHRRGRRLCARRRLRARPLCDHDHCSRQRQVGQQGNQLGIILTSAEYGGSLTPSAVKGDGPHSITDTPMDAKAVAQNSRASCRSAVSSMRPSK